MFVQNRHILKPQKLEHQTITYAINVLSLIQFLQANTGIMSMKKHKINACIVMNMLKIFEKTFKNRK